MSNSRMVDAVNRLVGNLLSGSGEVFLPGVGALVTERRPAQRKDKRTILPPCRVVSFTSQQQGASLVDEIARAAQVDAAKASEIYETWLSRVRGENTLTIEGVGQLKFKTFVLDPGFDAQLNPQGHRPVRIKQPRRFDAVLWIGVVAILIAVGFFGYQYLPQLQGGEVATAVEAEEVVTLPVLVDSAQPAASDSVAVSTAAPVATTDSTAPGATTAPAAITSAHPVADAALSRTPQAMQAGMRYVVLGVFSTPENALRAMDEALQKEPSLNSGIYRFGEKFLTSAFASTDAAACTEFIGSRSDRFPGMWTYTAR